MNFLVLTATLCAVAQVPTGEASPPPSEPSPQERVVRAAERSAAAAEASARAVERIAERLETSQLQAPAESTPPAAPGADWVGAIGVNLISLTGNSESLTVSGLASFERKTDDWVFGVKALGAYGQSRPAGDAEPQVVARNALGQARLDRRFTPILSGYGLAILEMDHLRSIEYRASGEAGAGLVWVDRKDPDGRAMFLRTDLALRFAHESRHQYFPTLRNLDDIQLVAPKLGAGFRYALSEDVAFTEDAEVLVNILGPVRMLFTSTSKLSTRLIERLSLGVGFQITYDSLPAEARLPMDTALTVGLEVGL